MERSSDRSGYSFNVREIARHELAGRPRFTDFFRRPNRTVKLALNRRKLVFYLSSACERRFNKLLNIASKKSMRRFGLWPGGG